MIRSSARFPIRPISIPSKLRSRCASAARGKHASLVAWIVLVIFLVVAVIAGIWISRHWRGWVADFGSQAIYQAIDTSNLPAPEKLKLKTQVDRVAKAFADGRITMERAAAIMDKLAHSPLMPSLVVAAVDTTYFNRSGLSNEEKVAGRLALERFAQGVMNGKIGQDGVDAVLSHVADRHGENQWQFRQNVSDQELRAAIDEAKSRADKAEIPVALEKFNPSEEVKRIVDEALNEK